MRTYNECREGKGKNKTMKTLPVKNSLLVRYTCETNIIGLIVLFNSSESPSKRRVISFLGFKRYL